MIHMLKKKKKKSRSYSTDVFDMPMVLDNPYLLNKKGKKKRRRWERKGWL